MRILKKLLLTAGLVGLMGTAGFAAETKAAVSDVEATVGDNDVDITWTDDYENPKDIAVKVSVNGAVIYDDKISSDEEGYTIEDLLDLINESGVDAGNRLSNATVKVTVDGKTATVDGKAFPDDVIYRIATAGSGFMTDFEAETYDGDTKTYSDVNRVYAVEDTDVTLYGNPYDGFDFAYWQDGSTVEENPYTLTVEKSVTVTGVTTSYYSDVTLAANGRTSTTTMVNVPVTLTWTSTPQSPDLNSTVTFYYLDGTTVGTSTSGTAVGGSTTWTPNRTGTFVLYATGTNVNGHTWETNTVSITVNPKESVAIKMTGENYITSGYKLKLKAERKGTTKNIKWEMKTSSDADITASSNTEVEIEPRVSVSAGSSKTITLVGTLVDPDTTEEANYKLEYVITVYPKPSLSQGSDRTLTITTPAKVNTGTESGGDDESNKTAFSVSKVKIFGVREDGSNFYSATKEVGDSNKTSFSLDSIMEDANKNLAFNKSQRVTFKIYPADSDGNINKKVLSSAEGNIYKITVNGTGIREMGYYGLKGQSINIQAIPSAGGVFNGYWKDDEKNTSDTRKVTVDGEKTYTAVLGARADAAEADSKLDKVPKTGQSNVFVYIMVVVVIGAAALGLYAYNKKRKSTI